MGQHVHVFHKKGGVLLADLADHRRQQQLLHHVCAPSLQPVEQKPLMCGVLVNQKQPVALFHNDIRAERFADDAVGRRILCVLRIRHLRVLPVRLQRGRPRKRPGGRHGCRRRWCGSRGIRQGNVGLIGLAGGAAQRQYGAGFFRRTRLKAAKVCRGDFPEEVVPGLCRRFLRRRRLSGRCRGTGRRAGCPSGQGFFRAGGQADFSTAGFAVQCAQRRVIHSVEHLPLV